MATTRHIAVKRQETEERIAAAVKTLGERFGVPAPAPLHPAVRRDANLARVAVQEQMADLLEAVVAATAPREDAATSATSATSATDGVTMTWVDSSPSPDLGAMKRDELNDFAAQWGVDKPDDYRTKADLIAAIEARIGRANNEGAWTGMGDPKQPQPDDEAQAEPAFAPEPRPADENAQGDSDGADAQGNDEGID